MIIFLSGEITDTNQTARSSTDTRDYAELVRRLTALTRDSACMTGIILASA
jgi:hypothetical protein